MYSQYIESAKTIKPYTGDNDGFYVSVLPNENSQKAIIEWSTENLKVKKKSIFNQKTQLHCTLMYSKERKPAGLIQSLGLLYGVGYSLDLFGPEQDTLVMLVHSRILEDIAQKWKALGAKSDYTLYKPHITLAKNIDEDILISLEFMQLIKDWKAIIMENPLQLYFDPEVLENIK